MPAISRQRRVHVSLCIYTQRRMCLSSSVQGCYNTSEALAAKRDIGDKHIETRFHSNPSDLHSLGLRQQHIIKTFQNLNNVSTTHLSEDRMFISFPDQS